MQQISPVLSVSELVQITQNLLEQYFSCVTVEGEIASFTRAQSGHWYFGLKDQKSQVRCVMFKTSNSKLNFQPNIGMQVQIRTRVSIYAERGDFQLIVEDLSNAGLGILKRQYDLLVQKLTQLGLFKQERKRAIPVLPSAIGIVTSPQAAALHDVLITLNKRFPSITVILYPCAVQGQDAPAQIINAINLANKHNKCQTLLLVRGGGSLEDLWAFNNEQLAHCIVNSTIPIISGVGHETDITIADLAADYRAATPTAAAAMACPTVDNYLQQVSSFTWRIMQSMQNRISLVQHKLQALQKRMRHPQHVIDLQRQQWQVLVMRLVQNMRTRISRPQEKCNFFFGKLHALSPLATLGRGYALVYALPDRNILMDAKNVNISSEIEVVLNSGRLNCKVIEKID